MKNYVVNYHVRENVEEALAGVEAVREKDAVAVPLTAEEKVGTRVAAPVGMLEGVAPKTNVGVALGAAEVLAMEAVFALVAVGGGVAEIRGSLVPVDPADKLAGPPLTVPGALALMPLVAEGSAVAPSLRDTRGEADPEGEEVCDRLTEAEADSVPHPR